MHCATAVAPIKNLAVKSKQRVSTVILGFGGLLLLFVLYSWGANALTQLTGFIYPVYGSYKALRTEDGSDDTMWLTYWVVFACFNLIESFTDFLMQRIPMYFFVKLVFLLWCFLPQTKGAGVIYNNIINPLISKYEAKIDKNLADIKKHGNNLTHELGDEFGADAVQAAAQLK